MDKRVDESTSARVLRVISEVFTLQMNESLLDSSIADDIAPTSLDQMTLFIALEDEFDHTIPQNEVAGIKTVKEIVAYIEGKLAT